MDIRKRLPIKTHILYVPRARNQLADWLSKVGATVDDEVALDELAIGELLESDPPPK
jgi:hypothetical protein